MRVLFVSDHAGLDLKRKLTPFVESLGYLVEDLGPTEYRADDDYPDLIAPLAARISQEPGDCFGIVIGGSGQGEAMVANRFPRVRAAVYYGGTQRMVTLSREHNDANVLSLGARFLSEEEAKAAVELWLSTRFTNEERHVRRVGKIDTLAP
jgi:ribose 5-phosphate isomerase B